MNVSYYMSNIAR